MLFNRKSTDDWPCFVSVLLLVRSSHVHYSSRLSAACQYFLQNFFLRAGFGSGKSSSNLVTARIAPDRPPRAFTLKILRQLSHPVQNQSVDCTGPFVVGTVARVGNRNKFDLSTVGGQFLINLTARDRRPGVVCTPKYQ